MFTNPTHLLLVIVITLAVALLLSLVFAWRRERHHRKREEIHRAVVADLLDRVMARSYGEYTASKRAEPGRPLRRRVMSDEEMAEIERQRLEGAAT